MDAKLLPYYSSRWPSVTQWGSRLATSSILDSTPVFSTRVDRTISHSLRHLVSCQLNLLLVHYQILLLPIHRAAGLHSYTARIPRALGMVDSGWIWTSYSARSNTATDPVRKLIRYLERMEQQQQSNHHQLYKESQVQGRIQTIRWKDTYARFPVKSLQKHFTLWLISHTQIWKTTNSMKRCREGTKIYGVSISDQWLWKTGGQGASLTVCTDTLSN